MPAFGLISASINVDGNSLPEYGVQINEEKKEVTCWIPSEAGKNFSVVWDTTNTLVDTSGYVVLDGRNVGCKFSYKGKPKKKEVTFERTSTTTCRDFSFGDITYTDDDQYLNIPTQDIGNIELKVWRIEITRSKDAQKWRNKYADNIPSATLHERSKKLGAHCVHFGDVRNISPLAPTTTKSKSLEVLATFIFRYRPIDMLRANAIVPPLPSPQPPRQSGECSKRKSQDDEVAELKDDPDGDIEERVARLKKELRDLESRCAKKQKVKIEKRERALVDSDVIDLT